MSDQKNRSPLPTGEIISDTTLPQEKGTAKKAYERPDVVYRAPLEAMASVCSPSPPSKSNPGLCPSGPISS